MTKSEIELIRGVNCDYAVQKLLEKELVIISGRKEDAVGKPLLYSTSKNFMDYFGINSADDLPKIKEILNHEIVEATKIEREEDKDESKKAEKSEEMEPDEKVIKNESEEDEKQNPDEAP